MKKNPWERLYDALKPLDDVVAKLTTWELVIDKERCKNPFKELPNWGELTDEQLNEMYFKLLFHMHHFRPYMKDNVQEAERIKAELIKAERIKAERIKTERIKAAQIKAERIEAERIKIATSYASYLDQLITLFKELGELSKGIIALEWVFSRLQMDLELYQFLAQQWMTKSSLSRLDRLVSEDKGTPMDGRFLRYLNELTEPWGSKHIVEIARLELEWKDREWTKKWEKWENC